MKKNYSILMICLISLLLLTSCLDNSRIYDYQQLTSDELEKEKLVLELDSLYRKEELSGVTTVVSVVGGVIGSVAVLWTIFQGYRTLKFQSIQQHQKQISDLLSDLSSPEQDVKIGAARGLNIYADDVLNDVISAIATEESFIVRSALEEVLTKISPKNLPRLFDINNRYFHEYPYLIGRLRTIGADFDFIYALFRLSEFSSRQLTRNENRHLYDYGKMIENRHQNLIKHLGKSRQTENDNLVLLAQQTTQVLTSTGNVIAKKLVAQEGKNLNHYPHPIHIASTNLYGVDISNIKLSGSVFCNCLFRHAKFENAILENCDFSGADLYDVSLSHADLTGSNFEHANLRASIGKKCNFNDSMLENAVISQSDLQGSSFKKTNLKRAQCKGTNLTRTIFSQAELNNTELHGANFENATFEDCTFYSAKLIETRFINTIIRNCQFNGADLQGTTFENSTLENVGFAGANLQKTTFRCQLTNTNFENAKNIDLAIM
ncbi:MAG: pentapeptide repeat-containing protein [Anaerolineales bacterium]